MVVDALVDRRLLEHCRPGARVIDAGKRGYGRVFMRQPEIDRFLVRLAKAGNTVVRLKGGDPCFFGRGGEEAEVLAKAGVPFEIVPGVSSVTAVPAYAGIPLTHRGRASVVTVVTGHEGRENPYLRESLRDVRRRGAPGVDWNRLPPDGTLVVLMGVHQLPEIVGRLRRAGWPGDTPMAAAQWGTWPFQRTVQATLADIVLRVREAKLGAPAVIVAGRVVDLRRKLAWFERLPLFGRTVAVTRAQAQASALARRLEADGARVLESPAIRVEPLPLSPRGRRYLRDLPRYDGVLFTSANAAEIFLRHWKARPSSSSRKGKGGGAEFWPDVPVYAVGPRTAEVLLRGGLPLNGVARESVAESLARTLGPAQGRRFLFPRAAEGRDVLIRALSAAGARVDLWPLYRTVPQRMDPAVRQALLSGGVDGVTFTSSSTAVSFMREFGPAQRRKIFSRARAFSIGPVTSAALRGYGLRPVQSRRATTDDLADTVSRVLRRKGS